MSQQLPWSKPIKCWRISEALRQPDQKSSVRAQEQNELAESKPRTKGHRIKPVRICEKKNLIDKNTPDHDDGSITERSAENILSQKEPRDVGIKTTSEAVTA